MLYLVLAGLERFFIEFIRLNPRLLFGLSEAQLISLIMIIVGSAGFYYFANKSHYSKFVPAAVNTESKKKQALPKG